MDVRRRPVNNQSKPSGELLKPHYQAKASDAFPLPLYLTNGLFFTMFFSVMYFLLHQWREKIRNSVPLHVVSLSELAAIVSLIASTIYLVGFFGIDFLQSIIRPSSDFWEIEDEDKPVMPCGQTLITPAVVSEKTKPPPTSAHMFDNDDNNIKMVVRGPIPTSYAMETNLGHCNSEEDKRSSPTSDCVSKDDDEIVQKVVRGLIPSYALESKLGDCKRAAAIRREALQRLTRKSLSGLPIEGFDYESILGQCCEMPVGYVQIPVGIAGPLLLNGAEFYVPMATTEGCLVASTNRGCKAICVSGGATCVVVKEGMTRAPVVRFGSAKRAVELKQFLEDPMNFDTLAAVFNRSSRFGRLQSIRCAIAGKNLYIRFCCATGDAMGMNMVSKGVQNVLDFLHVDFPDMDVMGISGNYCSDKKPAAVNWIEGRGKSVVCEAVIKEEVVQKVLKTTVSALVELNMLKNLTGSAMAGALGGFNAHASNIVSAVYLATGQDPAQNVESSHCITMMEAVNGGKSLHISVTMPSIEVGTVGGGTRLASQSACLNLLGVKGSSKDEPGSNSRVLATIVAGSVLAGELSLMSAISAGQLVNSHMKYNRSTRDMSKLASS